MALDLEGHIRLIATITRSDDFSKAFDTVPHDRLLSKLTLTKVLGNKSQHFKRSQTIYVCTNAIINCYARLNN